MFSNALPGAAKQSRLQSYYNIAEGNYLIGDRSGAARGIEQCLRLDPEHAPSLALQSKLLLEQSEIEAALASAEAAIASAPEELEYQVLRALILGNLDRREDAMAQIDTVLAKAQPGSEHARTAQHLKGLLKMAEEKWDDAADAFQKTYGPQPEASDTGRQLATEAYLEKARTAPDIEGALAAIDQAIELYRGQTGRENLEALSRLEIKRAQLLAQAGETQQATTVLQQIVGEDPDNLEATVTLASLYANREEWLALEDLIEPISKNPALADIALYLKGRVALARDRVGTARARFEEALELNANRPTALQHALEFYRSICFERLKRRDEAIKSLKRAVDGGYVPETPDEAVHLGRLLLRQKDLDPLLPTLEKALLRGNTSAEGWALLGRAHIKKGRNELALSALNQSLDLEPEQAGILALRGSLLRKIGDLQGALVDYERAHQLEPSSPVLSYEQGLVLLQLGRIGEAEPFLRVAARKLTTHVTLDLLHASCAYTLGKYEEAAQSLQQYLHPQLEGDALKQFKANQSDTAAYLHTLLSGKKGIQISELATTSKSATLYNDYARGKASRKQVLDWAGRAETPEQARTQICAASYWLAQLERARAHSENLKELLHIAIETGSPENPEFQFARWQLKHD
ncbi:tetratricopeptide repeat protein [Coraliomargarita sinensis]|uniref:tetratricopeptide repeat protein n=1 Tax=Coraliomargarita sinensis TaxID=2174842 RepID=UPI001304E154|nr:tetratricopeptide repeat protein [Coraliomargarita sinensis]